MEDYDKAISIQPDSAYLHLRQRSCPSETWQRRGGETRLPDGAGHGLRQSPDRKRANQRTNLREVPVVLGGRPRSRASSTTPEATTASSKATTTTPSPTWTSARKLIDPQLIHLYSADMHEVYFQSGIAYYDTGLYDQAIILFDKAIAVVHRPPITQPPTTTAAFPTSAKVATAGR